MITTIFVDIWRGACFSLRKGRGSGWCLGGRMRRSISGDMIVRRRASRAHSTRWTGRWTGASRERPSANRLAVLIHPSGLQPVTELILLRSSSVSSVCWRRGWIDEWSSCISLTVRITEL